VCIFDAMPAVGLGLITLGLAAPHLWTIAFFAGT
jgi:hypothetical protein